MTYEYKTLPLRIVLGITNAFAPSESFLSDDKEYRVYRQLINDGFRWVRTDMDVAIFERSSG
jgi:hypothetical protein